MAEPSFRRVKKNSPPAGWLPHAAMLLAFLISSLACGFVWLVPIEVIEQWAIDRAGSGEFDQLEAVGEANFYVWLFRITAPLFASIFWRVWSNLVRWQLFLADLWYGLAAITRSTTREDSSGLRAIMDRARTIGCRGLLLAWGIVFLSHSIHGIRLRAHDWPYFRFNSGKVVLPNISDSNRAVIKYLEEATPLSARILVASDQKLFFLSYYLRPRTLLHRMHSKSEHVIPLKNQERKLAAWRLDELTKDDLARMPHDYTLEYFEHPELVDRSQVLRDAAWVAFIRQLERKPTLIPSYQVSLRKVGNP